MPFAFAILIGLQLGGEVLRQTLHLPLPGPLIDMFLLTVVLVARGSAGWQPNVPSCRRCWAWPTR